MLSLVWGFVKDLLEIHQTKGWSKKKQEVIHAIILSGLWCIWNGRNQATFKGRRTSFHGLLEETKSLSYFWIISRAGGNIATWEEWCNFNFSL
ncbi:hypothetical protein R6Q59_015806 [Mikania micrantha]